MVPFGSTTTLGVCVADHVQNPHDTLKDILDVLDPAPLVAEDIMQLANWMTDYYHYPLGEILATVLPVAARKGRPAILPKADLWQAVGDAYSGRKAPAQQALFEFLVANGPQGREALQTAGHKPSTLRALFLKHLVQQLSHTQLRALSQDHTPDKPPEPTPEQAEAIAQIVQAQDTYQTFLLEGVTGSGKTEVYMQAMQQILQQASDPDPQVLVLVPEIALTPQTLARFAARFANVGMLHSNLTDLDRFNTWLRCREGHTQVLIGTRSAIFTPFKNLRMIIVDEEHDSSYKQQEGLRYSARDLAAKRGLDLSIPVVLGSATPSLESLHNVKAKRYTTLPLTQRATGASMPSYHLIDMRGQDQSDGLSVPLQRVIRTHLADNAQVLIYLNRRGFAPTLLCRSCGWQATCSACDARLTLHSQPNHLRCHHCGFRAPVHNQCGECKQPALMPVGLGTQRTEEALAKLFPNVPVYRIDRDSVRSNAELEARFKDINSGHSAILVGTQMLAKGHHFPNVTLVGVINADAGFLSPDFRAPERTAQLIEQVAGRAGRAHRPGQVWIQTFQPENPTLRKLISEGYLAFADLELKQRTEAGLPPAAPMAMLRADILQNAEPNKTNEAIDFLNQCKHAITANDGLTCLGPIPAPLGRLAGRLRYQLMILATHRTQLHRALHPLINVKPPRQVRWSIDVDPYDSL